MGGGRGERTGGERRGEERGGEGGERGKGDRGGNNGLCHCTQSVSCLKRGSDRRSPVGSQCTKEAVADT